MREADKIAVAKLEQLAGPAAARVFGQRMLSRHWSAGEIVLRAGSGSHGLYVLVEGQLDRFLEHGGQQLRVGSIAQGSFFGEAGFFDRASATTTVVAATPAHVLELTLMDFEHAAEQQPDMAADLLRGLVGQLADRVGETNAQILGPGAGGEERGVVARLVSRLFRRSA